MPAQLAPIKRIVICVHPKLGEAQKEAAQIADLVLIQIAEFHVNE